VVEEVVARFHRQVKVRPVDATFERGLGGKTKGAKQAREASGENEWFIEGLTMHGPLGG
jgi:hypothetical protein